MTTIGKGFCYACTKPKHGRRGDHCPPRAFFPEQKDLPADWPDMRVELITVPSCEEHNQAVSKDDEYAFFVSLLPIQNNSVALQLMQTKALRAFKQRPALVKTLSRKRQDVVLPSGDRSYAFQFDRTRFDDVMIKIACGLYYHHHEYQERWQEPLFIESACFHTPDLEGNPALDYLNVMRTLISGCPKHGHNPLAFYYQFLSQDEPSANGGQVRARLMRLVFYEGLEIFVMRQPPNAEPRGNARGTG